MKKDFVVSVFVYSKIDDIYNVLLLHHKKLNKWLIPGGHVEYGENPIETALREIKEETGLNNIEFVSFIHNERKTYSDALYILPPEYVFEETIQPYKCESLHKHIDLIYVAIAKDTDIKVNLSESLDIKWVSESDICNFDLFDMTKGIAQTIFAKLKSD